ALEIVRLNGAARGHVFGIEIQHHPLATILRQADRLAFLRVQGEVRRGRAYSGNRSSPRQARRDDNDGGDQNEKSENFAHEKSCLSAETNKLLPELFHYRRGAALSPCGHKLSTRPPSWLTDDAHRRPRLKVTIPCLPS